MRRLMTALLCLAPLCFVPLAAQADPPIAVTPDCAQFGTETGYLCSFTRRINLSWVCLEFGFGSGPCATAYVDCEVSLVWWENEPYDEMDASVDCGTPVYGS